MFGDTWVTWDIGENNQTHVVFPVICFALVSWWCLKKSIAICRSSEAKPDISGVEAAPWRSLGLQSDPRPRSHLILQMIVRHTIFCKEMTWKHPQTTGSHIWAGGRNSQNIKRQKKITESVLDFQFQAAKRGMQSSLGRLSKSSVNELDELQSCPRKKAFSERFCHG